MKRAWLYQTQKVRDKFLCEFHTVGEILKSIATKTEVVINIL
jgi:hypothetical protein